MDTVFEQLVSEKERVMRVLGISVLLYLTVWAPVGRADVLELQEGDPVNGELTSFDGENFLFGVREGSGIFLGRYYAKEEVARIVLSSSEDNLVVEYRELAQNEDILGTTVENLKRPLDIVELKSGSQYKGRLMLVEDGMLRLDISSLEEPLNVRPIPLGDVNAVALSNSDLQLQQKVSKLQSLLDVRISMKQQQQTEIQELERLRQLQIRIRKEGERPPFEGSILSMPDMEKYYSGNTFEVSPELNVEDTPGYYPSFYQLTPSGDRSGVPAVPEGGFQPIPREAPKDQTIKEKQRQRLKQRLDGKLNRGQDQSSNRTRHGRNRSGIPFIRSVEIIGAGYNRTVIVDYE